ncbi:MAG: NADH-quinone oxidoreductase subunit L, partial [Planctomycetaceae bacterium]
FETRSLTVAAKHEAHDESHGSYARFFATLQFFVFTMLGLIIAGNLLQVFMFWELVGAASYFLIGYYWDRSYAAAAATKAFVMNRIGDAGFLIGIAILWTAFGTLQFGGRGVFHTYQGETVRLRQVGMLGSASEMPRDHFERLPYGAQVDRSWLVVAGLCLFAGCVGKSAQLPLSTWLPDAMAGPTPVSALVHSATMVAAGVYLVGRVYPLFLPEVRLVIAYVGAFTLVYGATCALVQTDLKRILAWSTVSQLGYMMLALGVDFGGREAGLFHLVTHAFFKSLLFLAAGSVIVACHHVQDVSRLGGLRKRMPLTAYTSLVGVIAIAGLALPTESLIDEAIAFSGYHSKDMILASALAFTKEHPQHALLFALPIVTAGLTAFYMFRFWFLTFAGKPRDEDLHHTVKESSFLMTVPLVVLACFAAFVAVGGDRGVLCETIRASRAPNPADAFLSGVPHYYAYQSAHHTASLWGLIAATTGTALALLVYGTGLVKVRHAAGTLGPTLGLLRDGWRLDAMQRALVVRPVMFVASGTAAIDRLVFDPLAHGLGKLTLGVSRLDRIFDEVVVDGLVNRLADVTWATGRGLRHVQTGHLRQYVMALAAAAAILFALAVVLIPK